MALDNVTAIITSAVTGNNNGANDMVWLFLVLGGIVGTFLAIMLPYYREKRKFGKEGIDLFFDKDFLKVGAGALVISIISIGAIYPALLAQADPAASYGSAFIAAATLAFTLNVGGSWIIGTNNKEAEEQLVEKKVATKLAEQSSGTGSNSGVLNTNKDVSNNNPEPPLQPK